LSNWVWKLSGLSKLQETTVILLGSNNIIFILVTHLREPLLGNEFQEEVDQKGDKRNANTQEPLNKSETFDMDTHSSLTQEDDGDLTEEDSEPDTKEQWVLADTLEDV